jgi:PAS domain S-box-containing protein
MNQESISPPDSNKEYPSFSSPKRDMPNDAVADKTELTPHLLSLCHDLLDYSKSLETELEDLKCILSTTMQHSTTMENDLSLQQEASATLWKRYEFIVNASQEWIAVINADLTFETVNEAFAQACKKNKSSIIKQPISKIWKTPEELEKITKWVSSCLNNNDIRDQTALHMPNRFYPYVDVVGMPYQVPGQPTSQVVLIAKDVSARRHVETLLRDRSMFLDQVHDAVVVIDQNNRIYFWNKQAEIMYGWKSHQVVEKKDASIFLAPNEMLRLESIFATVQKNNSWQGRMHHLYRQKQEVSTVCTWTPLSSENGTQFYLLTAVNITPLRKLENEYNRLQRFYTATQIFIESSHDLNNAMVTYMSTTRMIRDHIPKNVMGGLFTLSDDAIRKSMNIVKRMLEYGRGKPMDHTPFEVAPIIYDLAKMLGVSLPNTITLETKVSDDTGYVFGNSTEIHQVLLNLCINAKDAIRDKEGRITITVSKRYIRKERIVRPHMETVTPGHYILITVSDTGHGIRKRQLNDIFTPFFSTKRLGEGTGVGLASVYRIIKNHNGWIHASSKPLHGTRFTLFLPSLQKIKGRIQQTDTAKQGPLQPLKEFTS